MAEEPPPRKAKRTAEHQINKDEDPEGDGIGDTGASVPGTFQRAPPEVLEGRKIVKARLKGPTPATRDDPGGGNTAPAEALLSNPFKNLTALPAPATSIAKSTDQSEKCTATESAASLNGNEPSAGAGELARSAVESKADKSKEVKNNKAHEILASAGKNQVSEKSQGEKPPADQSTKDEAELEVSAEHKDEAQTASTQSPASSFLSLGAGRNPFQGVKDASSTFPGFGSAAASAGDPLGKGTGNASLRATTSETGIPTAGTATVALPLSFATPKVGSSSSFGFGSLKPTGWGREPKSDFDGTPNGEVGDKDGISKDASNATKVPLEGLVDPSEVINGEEMEECVHRARAKLFRLKEKEWLEMGVGTLKVLRRKETGECGDVVNGNNDATQEAKDNSRGIISEADISGTAAGGSGSGSRSRLVMRREAGQQVVLNLSLQAQVKLSKQGEKALQMTCFTPEGPATYLIKVKTGEDADTVKNAVESNTCPLSSGGSENVPVGSPSTPAPAPSVDEGVSPAGSGMGSTKADENNV